MAKSESEQAELSKPSAIGALDLWVQQYINNTKHAHDAQKLNQIMSLVASIKTLIQ